MNLVNGLLATGLLILIFLYVSKIRTLTKPKYDGQIVITVQENSKKVFTLEDIDPEEMEKKKFVVFKIVSKDPLVEE